MSKTYSHHDSTREKVGVTAFFVAALRAREHNKVEGRLFSDPYAQCLAGDHIEQTTNYMYPSTTGAALPQEAAFHKDTKEEVKVIPQGKALRSQLERHIVF
jgi:O-methyltransferase involved in polyketide biosynthesis